MIRLYRFSEDGFVPKLQTFHAEGAELVLKGKNCLFDILPALKGGVFRRGQDKHQPKNANSPRLLNRMPLRSQS